MTSCVYITSQLLLFCYIAFKFIADTSFFSPCCILSFKLLPIFSIEVLIWSLTVLHSHTQKVTSTLPEPCLLRLCGASLKKEINSSGGCCRIARVRVCHAHIGLINERIKFKRHSGAAPSSRADWFSSFQRLSPFHQFIFCPPGLLFRDEDYTFQICRKAVSFEHKHEKYDENVTLECIFSLFLTFHST